MPFNEFPFLRYILFFLLGVALYPFAGILDHSHWFVGCVVFFIAYSFYLFLDIRKKGAYYKWLLPMLAYSILVLSGITFSLLKDVTNDSKHLLFQGEIEGYLAEVKEIDVPKARSVANRVGLIAVRKGDKFIAAKGDVLLYHTGVDSLSPGEVYWIPGQPDLLEDPQYPQEFNYAQFMARQQIFHRQFVREGMLQVGERTARNLSTTVILIRHALEGTIDKHVYGPQSKQIAKALLLGQKGSLEHEVSEAYVTAGAMHVLAVSGLHVGIIYGFFFLFWKPNQLSPHKRIPLLMVVIGIIWCYALITGMSPSVLRAATMFSLMGLAQMQSRNPSIYNPLALSALILVLYDPFIVFSVGFQLSYIALLGILLFQPVIVSWWTPKNKLVDYIWQITSVGIAAQLATFPLSIHYFHVFPTYFMVANVIAIPGAFAIMACGIPFLVLSFIEPIAQLMGVMLDYLISWVNTLIFSVQYLPFSRMENLSFRWIEMLLIWGFIWCVYILISGRKRKMAYLCAVLAVFIVGMRWWDFQVKQQTNELVVYKIGKGTAVDYFYKGQLYFLKDGVSDLDVSYKISPNRIQYGMSAGKPLAWKRVDAGLLIYLPDSSTVRLSSPPEKVRAKTEYFHAGKWHHYDSLTSHELPSEYALRYFAK